MEVMNKEQEIQEIVEFWTNMLTNPSEYLNGKFDYEDAYNMAKKSSVASEFPLEKEEIEQFAQLLTNTLGELFEKEWDVFSELVLECDYRPEGVLGWVAEQTNISSLFFPIKVFMRIVPGQYAYVQLGRNAILEIYGQRPKLF